jgi:hypothetical protein
MGVLGAVKFVGALMNIGTISTGNRSLKRAC